MTIHGAGFSARLGGVNNEKSKAAGEGIFCQCAILKQGFAIVFGTDHLTAW